MASYNELNALIDAYINRNGVQAITGQILNGVLKAMVEQLGRGYTIMGAATPTTDPGTPDGPECYFASTPGTYTDFDGLQVVPGELALLCYTPTDGWMKNTIYEGFQAVNATIDGNVGTPSVGVSYADGVLSFDFHNMKGNPGDAAGFGTIGADIAGGVGTPGVSVESSGPATAKNLQFHFTNLKGETGVTSVVATVDNTTGNPACTVSLVGQQLTLAFSGLKGAQGDTGVSADYPIAIVNNLTTNDPASALSAAQGVVLDGKVTQLEAKVDDLSTGKYYGYFAKEEDLPEADVDGFAYVGEGPTYTIYNCVDGVWTSSDITVNQSPIGNEEDIDQNEDGKLQFANRVYNDQQPNGMGYKILRKDATFASQVTDTNTIYEIRYDFNLGGATVTIPTGCVLRFDGGKILNGTINFGNTLIDADDIVVFEGVTFANCTSNQKVKTIWFGITTNGQSNAAILENILDSFAYVFVNPGSYTMEGQITIANTARIKEFTADKSQMAINAVLLTFPNSNGFVIKKRIYMCGVSISGNRGTYNAQDKVFENGYVGIDLYVACVFEYCTITTWATGIETYNGSIVSGVIRKCVFEKCGNYGLRFYSDSTVGSNNANLITDNYFVNCGYAGLTAGTDSTGKTSGIGMYVKGGSGNTILHNVFEYCSGIGLFIDQPTTASIYRGLVIIGNYFEYCKWSNMYVDLNTTNSSLVWSIIIKGNSYSDSNLQLPADAQRNRYCNILDLYGMMFERYIQTDFADRTLYQKYSGPLLFDMSMLTFYNTGWDKIDWSNNCIRFIQGSNAEAFTFVRGKAKRGYYAIMVNCRNAGSSNKVLSIQYKIDGQSTITRSISLTTQMNTFERNIADIIFSNKEFEIVLQGAYSGSMQAGDRVEFNEIVLQEITSVTTAVRETLTPYAGFSIFDSTLNKMVVYNGSAWVNMDGTALS